MRDIIQLIRVKQWVKNLFVFVPMIFSGNLLSPQIVISSVMAFIAFSLMASTVYIINDLCDLKGDRQHPVKCLRPLASGKVKTGFAVILAVILAILSFIPAICFSFNMEAILILAGYLLLNILYSFGLKKVAILDVMIIAFGFVLRVLFGGVACGIPVTAWLVMMVFLLTMLIGFGKRRDDLLRLVRDDLDVRKSVAGYNLNFIDQVMGILAALVIMAYIAYTLTAEVMERFNSQYVYFTAVFVIGAVLRYLQLALVKEQTGNPTELVYNDRFTQVCCILWILSFLVIIYL